MKILHTVESYLPDVNGMQEVVKQISEKLAKKGHDITIATKFNPKRDSEQINGIKIKQFKISGNQVAGYDATEQEMKKYQDFILDSDFDIIVNFAAQQWATDLVLPLLKKIKAAKVFVPTGFSALYSDIYKEYFEKMKDWMKDYDMNVFLSNDYRDINFAKKNGIEKRILIPNGACEKEFLNNSRIDINKLLNVSPSNFLILNVGGHTGVKGHREAIQIYQESNIPNSVFLIIAKGDDGCSNYCRRKSSTLNRSRQFKKMNKKIEVTSWNRPETVAAYKRADLFLFTSNIECSPLVIFEACASKTPFLSTDVGNVKEIIEWTKGGQLLPTQKGVELNHALFYRLKKPAKRILAFFNLYKGIIDHIDYNLAQAKIDESVSMLKNIYHDKNKRKELAKNGFESWQKNFTWQKIAEKYEQLYKSLI